MGRSGSSRRKYSLKKKSLKVSSEGYRKKKSRRNKTKKLRHPDDSFSSCSDDESSSSSLYSSSSSDGEYKRERSRSRARNEVKGRKKRSRIRSSSEDDSSPVKKRNKSKKNKNMKKKKSKRGAYISSASSDSESCSTCKDEDSSSDEGGSHGGSRGRSRQKGRMGNKKNRTKTRSSSQSKLSDSYDNESVEKVTTEHNPVRLKSVITVANLENEEEDNMNKDELKEETVCDYDDYPSCKSNDSNEFIDRSNISPERKGIPSSVTKEVNSSSSLNDSKEQESTISGKVGSETDNLESVLRQKALENLSRFQGTLKTKQVDLVESKHKINQSGVKQAASVSMTPVSQPVVNRTRFTWRRDPSVTTGKYEKAATYSGPHSSGSQPAGLKLPSADLSSASKVENQSVNETSKVMVNTNNVDQNSTPLVASSSASSEEGSSKEQHTESNDNSQFEKKTMSVMRGGEMVQVSYKVYIPSRAPALARRQLKR